MSKIRVLIQQPILPPYRLAVFNALIKNPKLDVTFAYGNTTKGRPLESISNPPGLKVHTFDNIAFGEGPKILAQPKIFGIIRRVKPDVALFALNPRNPTSLLASRLLRKKGVPVVFWGHGVRPAGRIRQFYETQTKWADATVLYYPQGKEELVEMGVPAEKLFVAWNSIETEEIADLADSYNANRKTIICVGRLIPAKKVPLLMDAFEYAVEKLGLEANLVVVGDGPDKKIVDEKYQSSKHKDRITIKGALWKQTDLAPYFNDSYVAVSAGQVGLNAIHCMAYGVPMLCADDEPHSPEIMALKEGENARFFKANSVEDFAQKLVDMRNNPKELAKLSENAFEYTHKTFSAQKMANNIADAIIYAYNQRKS